MGHTLRMSPQEHETTANMAVAMFSSGNFYISLCQHSPFARQCIRKQCTIWKHWLRGPLTPFEHAMLREKEHEWQLSRGRIKEPAKRQSAWIRLIILTW